MRQRIVFRPKEAPESTRIVEAHAQAGVEHDVDVIVQLRRRGAGQQPQASGHSQVQDHRAALEVEQQVLRASPQVAHALTGSSLSELSRYTPSQARLANDDLL